MTNITFKFQPSDEPECEDDQTLVLIDDRDSGYAIQHTFGEFGLNRYYYDSHGRLIGMQIIDLYPTLALASAAAIAKLQVAA